MSSLYFCVVCESPRLRGTSVEVLASSEKQAIHEASIICPDHENYRVLVPEPVVRYSH